MASVRGSVLYKADKAEIRLKSFIRKCHFTRGAWSALMLRVRVCLYFREQLQCGAADKRWINSDERAVLIKVTAATEHSVDVNVTGRAWNKDMWRRCRNVAQVYFKATTKKQPVSEEGTHPASPTNTCKYTTVDTLIYSWIPAGF